MSEQRLVVDRLYEAFNARRFDAYHQLLDENVLLVFNGQSLHGARAVSEWVASAVRELPGVRVERERDLASSGDTVVDQTRYVDLTSEAGPGRALWGAWQLPVTLCAVYRISGGRIVECHNYVDPDVSGPLPGRDVAPWPGVASLVAEQAALRRVATLVAHGAKQAEVFDAIVAEAAKLLGLETWLLRYEVDDTATVIAVDGGDDVRELTGRAVSASASVLRSVRDERPARIGNFTALPDADADLARRLSGASVVAAPLLVQGIAWGSLSVVSRERPLPPGIEDRLVQFADLAATAVANAQSGAELQLLADEQGALRRVAELVARGAATEEVLEQVTVEAGRLLDDSPTILFRYERSGSEAVVVARSRPTAAQRRETYYSVGSVLPVPAGSGRALVRRTGGAARIDSYARAADTGIVALGFAASVSAPITVDGRLWGALTAGSPGPPLPVGTEERLARFCELVGTAIANAESRAALTASRVRIVAAGDQARRRFARDVHDGAQQRLVHTLITLKQARAALGDGDTEAVRLLDESLTQAQSANEQLRELAHGILPAALARGGLRAAVDSLVAHLALPVDTEVLAGRLSEPVETAAYFVIAEALTNTVKHARARRARVRVAAGDGRLQLEIKDDGRGGADPARGWGLVGLADRVEAAGGTMTLSSPPTQGTTVSVTLPLPADRPGT